MENPTHSFREMKFQLVQELRIKSKTVMVGALDIKERISCKVYFVRRKFL